MWLDFLSINKAAQAISQEIELNELLETLMEIVLSNAGAQTGCLVLSKHVYADSANDTDTIGAKLAKRRSLLAFYATKNPSRNSPTITKLIRTCSLRWKQWIFPI